MPKNTKLIAGGIICMVLVIAVVVYLLTLPPAGPPGGGENLPPENEGGKPGVLEMPIEETTAALASSEGVSQENIEIQFCELASETDNDHFAVGAIVMESKSMVFIFENSTSQITLEDNYTAVNDVDVEAISVVKRQLSKWTGNKVVPGWFENISGNYQFKYYDGYSVRFDRWLWGVGTLNLDNKSVSWGMHSV
jgi:hypothetical protein